MLIMSERLKLPASCRTIARHASRKDTLGDAGELRSCPKHRTGAEIGPEFGQVWQTPPTTTGGKVVLLGVATVDVTTMGVETRVKLRGTSIMRLASPRFYSGWGRRACPPRLNNTQGYSAPKQTSRQAACGTQPCMLLQRCWPTCAPRW